MKSKKMRWFFALVALAIGMTVVAIGCDKTDPEPEFLSVTITNKTELTGAWKLGEADRTVALSFSPEYYTESNTG